MTALEASVPAPRRNLTAPKTRNGINPLVETGRNRESEGGVHDNSRTC